MALPLSSFTPAELPALALVFGLALAEPLDDDDALLLASFISTISSNIVLFVTQRSNNFESAQPTGATGPVPTGPMMTGPMLTGQPPTQPIIIPRGPGVRGVGPRGAFGAQ